jgi:hypothetical protein
MFATSAARVEALDVPSTQPRAPVGRPEALVGSAAGGAKASATATTHKWRLTSSPNEAQESKPGNPKRPGHLVEAPENGGVRACWTPVRPIFVSKVTKVTLTADGVPLSVVRPCSPVCLLPP